MKPFTRQRALGRIVPLLLAGWAMSACATGARPNVVFIIADDMNTYGPDRLFPMLKTPHLDRLRAGGIAFERAYCAAPACVPSRAAFFSGLNPVTTGAYLNGCDPWRKPPFAGVESLPELFRRAGYETWGGGKLFHAPIDAERRRRAWDNQPRGGGFGPFLEPEDQLAGKWWGAGPWSGPDTDFPDVRNTADAAAFLRRRHDRPFFLALGLWRPHTPFTAPKRFFDLYDAEAIPLPPPGYLDNDLVDVPPEGRRLAAVWGERWTKTGEDDPDLWRRIVWAYFACTTFADWSIGRVMEALDSGPHARNTIVIFFSDNGYHCGEKDHFEKSTLWEAATRVPLVIRLPGGRGAGRRVGTPVSLVDLFPTLRGYCRLPEPPQRLEGHSLRPLLEGGQAERPRPVLSACGEGSFTLRDARFRYIRYPDGAEELYDHEWDAWEWRNRAEDPGMAAVLERFRGLAPRRFAPSLGGRDG